MNIDAKELIRQAKEARTNAYAPYSVYQVGAAVLGADGNVYSGCNVENVSFGLSLCAERSAVSAMIVNGCRQLDAVAVVTSDGGTPCGMCRQVLAEFASGLDVKILCADETGNVQSFTVEELLPQRFRTDIGKD